MPELLPSFHSRFSSDSAFSWHSSPPRVPTPPLTFDGSDWYADDAFPRPITIHDKFRYREQANSATLADIKTPRMTDIRPVDRLSLSLSDNYYPRRPSPLSLPPDPEEPAPNVPVPFPPKVEVDQPKSETSDLKRTLSTCSKLKKKRRETVDGGNDPTMLAAQVNILLVKTDHKNKDEVPEDELGTPNMLLLRRCFVEKYIPASPKVVEQYPFALLSRLSLVH